MKINGTVIIPNVDSTAFVHSTNATLSLELDNPDATTKDSGGFADSIEGLRSWTLTIEGYATYDSSGNVQAIDDLYFSRSTASMEFAPTTNGDRKYTGTIGIESLELGAPMEETATISVTFPGKGELTRTTVS